MCRGAEGVGQQLGRQLLASEHSGFICTWCVDRLYQARVWNCCLLLLFSEARVWGASFSRTSVGYSKSNEFAGHRRRAAELGISIQTQTTDQETQHQAQLYAGHGGGRVTAVRERRGVADVQGSRHLEIRQKRRDVRVKPGVSHIRKGDRERCLHSSTGNTTTRSRESQRHLIPWS